MVMKAKEDFKTLTELEENLPGVLHQVHRTGRPVVITKRGRPDVVIMDAASYRKRLEIVHLGALLAEAEADIAAGRTQPVDEVFDELEREKIPRPRRRKGQKRSAPQSRSHRSR